MYLIWINMISVQLSYQIDLLLFWAQKGEMATRISCILVSIGGDDVDWLERLYRAQKYMEDNLASEISYEKAAQIACCSSYHFQRMFSFISGVSLAEYIRRRRLTLAAIELQSGNEKVIDLAFKYGYESPDAFTRAFQKQHGVTPSAARGPGVLLKAYPRISFQITVRGDREMNYKIVEMPEFKVVGKGKQVSTQDGENNKIIPAFWWECFQNGFSAQLEKLADKRGVTGKSKLGICMESTEDLSVFTYLIGVEYVDGSIPEGFREVKIPAATWAVFESVGPMPDAIQNLNQRIYGEWFPSTGYERAGGLDMEVYPEGDADDDQYRCEIWIPVMKR